MSMDDGATWTASDFATDVQTLQYHSTTTLTNLANWNGPAETTPTLLQAALRFVISAIHVNPTLDDVTFRN